MPGDGSWPTELEQAFLDAVEAAEPGLFPSRLDHEPREFTGYELPALCLLVLQAPDEDHQTGPATQVTWGWSVRIYCTLALGYEQGQAQLKAVWPALLKAIRSDPSLGVDGAWARLRDPGGEPEFSEREEWVMKRLTLEIRREELS